MFKNQIAVAVSLQQSTLSSWGCFIVLNMTLESLAVNKQYNIQWMARSHMHLSFSLCAAPMDACVLNNTVIGVSHAEMQCCLSS